MQIVVWDRETLTGAITVETPAIDVEGIPVVEVVVSVHGISGTSPQLTLQLQTSDDMETWADVGADIDMTATGYGADTYPVVDDLYARYVRIEAALTGTDPVVNATVSLNTYESS